jgi:hypothetical protein
MQSVKIPVASQARSIRQYKNVKRKILICNANIHFNRECIKRNITPKYANIKIPSTSPAEKHTKKETLLQRIKDEGKFLYVKKTKSKPRTLSPTFRSNQ